MSETKSRSRWMIPLLLLLVISVGFNLYHLSGKHSDKSQAGEAAKQMYVCPMHPSIVQDHPGDCPICGMKLVPMKNAKPEESSASPQNARPEQTRKIAYYRSPMDAKDTSPVARKDEMGMEYVPVYEDELNNTANAVQGRSEVMIDPARQQLIGLKTAAVTQGSISGGWQTVGKVESDPTKVAMINVKVSGYVERVFVDFVGKAVRRGEPLFSFYSPEIYGAEQEYLLAVKSRDAMAKRGGMAGDGDAMVDAVRQKLKLWDVPDSEIKRLDDSHEASKNVTFYSPVSGVVTAKDIVEGSSLMPGATPYEITDLSTVWVMADAYQSDIERVKVGMPAVLRLQGIPGREFSGKVTFIDPRLDPESRTLKVRITFANPKGELKPDLFGQVTLRGMEHQALTIPADAVIPTGSRSMVFVAMGDGKFQPREVKLGATSGDQVEVVAGLKEGESVVTRANFLIDSESSLRAALSAMQGS